MASSVDKSKFVGLLVEHQPRIYAYIRTLVPDRTAAEDVYQETCVTLWEKFDDFDPTMAQSAQPFLNWSLGVARYAVLAHHRDNSRNRLRFNDEDLSRLAVETAADCEDLSDLRAALDHCLGRLPERSRRLVAQRYQPGASVQQIAEELQRPVATVYSTLKRLRTQLYQCIERTMRRSSTAGGGETGP